MPEGTGINPLLAFSRHMPPDASGHCAINRYTTPMQSRCSSHSKVSPASPSHRPMPLHVDENDNVPALAYILDSEEEDSDPEPVVQPVFSDNTSPVLLVDEEHWLEVAKNEHGAI